MRIYIITIVGILASASYADLCIQIKTAETLFEDMTAFERESAKYGLAINLSWGRTKDKLEGLRCVLSANK